MTKSSLRKILEAMEDLPDDTPVTVRLYGKSLQTISPPERVRVLEYPSFGLYMEVIDEEDFHPETLAKVKDAILIRA